MSDRTGFFSSSGKNSAFNLVGRLDRLIAEQRRTNELLQTVSHQFQEATERQTNSYPESWDEASADPEWAVIRRRLNSVAEDFALTAAGESCFDLIIILRAFGFDKEQITAAVLDFWKGRSV